MRQLVTGLTRKLATLDKIYTNIANWFEKPVMLPGISRSDHDSVLMAPSACLQRPRRRMLQQCRRSSDPNGKTLLCHHLKHFDWRTLYSLDNCADMVNYLYSVIQSLLNYYLPMIKVTMCTTDNPWVTPSFRALVNRQRAFMRGDLVRYHRLRETVPSAWQPNFGKITLRLKSNNCIHLILISGGLKQNTF